MTLHSYTEVTLEKWQCHCTCHKQPGGICCSCDCDYDQLVKNPPTCLTPDMLRLTNYE